MWQEIELMINTLKNKQLRKLVSNIYKTNKKKQISDTFNSITIEFSEITKDKTKIYSRHSSTISIR